MWQWEGQWSEERGSKTQLGRSRFELGREMNELGVGKDKSAEDSLFVLLWWPLTCIASKSQNQCQINQINCFCVKSRSDRFACSIVHLELINCSYIPFSEPSRSVISPIKERKKKCATSTLLTSHLLGEERERASRWVREKCSRNQQQQNDLNGKCDRLFFFQSWTSSFSHQLHAVKSIAKWNVWSYHLRITCVCHVLTLLM